jgi:Kef-type K+ transport system membrane component KefB
MLSLPTLLIQISVIILVARLVGLLFRKIHQPQVMGEMLAGILLGPSLLGWLAPGVAATLFPPASLDILSGLSQIGLLIYMFLVGLELDLALLRGRRRAAVVISQVSIAAPFVLGFALALFLAPRLSDPGVPPLHFALFIGVAMSITAFPVLARILTERNMIATSVGSQAITCAAIDDVTGWCLLAGVILVSQAGRPGMSLGLMIGGLAAFVLALLLLARPLTRRLSDRFERDGKLSRDALALILALALLSGLTTEWLGIHAVFGAFLFGATMPRRPAFIHALTHKLEDVAVVLLLPLFFAFTGLRTRVGLVSGGELWLYAGLILLVAVAGKFGGATLAARATGSPWRESAALGILMNTRGLMELVILNIGLDVGILSPAMFTLMALMALATTFMTSPLLEWVYFRRLLPGRYDVVVGGVGSGE